jgi:TolA-binding protein
MIAVLVALVGPSAWAGSQATADYARQVSTAQVRLAQLEALLVESQLRIEQLEEVIREQGQNEAEKLQNFDQVNAEVTRLRGAIEVLQFDVTELKRTVKEQQLQTEKRLLYGEMRLAQIEKMLSLKPPPPPTDADLGLAAATPTPAPGPDGTPAPAPAPTAPPEQVPDTAAGKLELAASHMAEGRNPVARAILKAALDQHVGAPEMDEIRYRYAETFFNEQDWKQAISRFNDVINNHPTSPWKCWSFFRQGEAFEAMGKAEGAAAFYKGATEGSCKASEAARKAKEKL